MYVSVGVWEILVPVPSQKTSTTSASAARMPRQNTAPVGVKLRSTQDDGERVHTGPGVSAAQDLCSPPPMLLGMHDARTTLPCRISPPKQSRPVPCCGCRHSLSGCGGGIGSQSHGIGSSSSLCPHRSAQRAALEGEERSDKGGVYRSVPGGLPCAVVRPNLRRAKSGTFHDQMKIKSASRLNVSLRIGEPNALGQRKRKERKKKKERRKRRREGREEREEGAWETTGGVRAHNN